MNIDDLKFKQLSEHRDETVRVERFNLWGSDLELYFAPNTVFFPKIRLQAWNGIAPVEAVNYESHLDLAKSRVPNDEKQFEISSAEYLDIEVCILANPCSPTFGHWAEELPKVLILEQRGFMGKYVLPPSPQAVWFDSLALLGVGRDRIIVVERETVFGIAVFTGTINHFNAHRYTGVFRALRDHLYSATEKLSGAGERIWMARGIGAHGSARDVLNMEEVYGVLDRYGFQTIDFGQLTFAEQIAIDRDTRAVAGAHGSAFVHVGFMQRGTEVLEIFPPHFINASVIQLCIALEHRYHQMVPVHTPLCPHPPGGILVDTDHLTLILNSMCN